MLISVNTEGLADMERANKMLDVWIFVLAILLSVIFIFNSRDFIDNNSLGDFHRVTELSDHMVVYSAKDDRDNVSSLAVCDFFLDGEIDGKAVTAKDLEWRLA